jgi:hypothetical protein
MVTKIMKWVSITALLLAVSWRLSANYQIPLEFLVCAGAVLVVLALYSIKHRTETHYGVDGVDKRSNPRRVTVKGVRARF